MLLDIGRHERELEVLVCISRLLAAPSGQRQMLTAMLRELEEKLGLLRGTVMLLSPDGSELIVEAAPDIPSPQHTELRYRCGEGVIGAVVQTGQPALIPRVSQEPRFTNRIHKRPTAGDADISFLCVPIALGSEAVGTLSVDVAVADRARLHERQRFLEIVASLIAYDVKSRRVEALQRQHLEAENLRLRDALQERFRPENILGNSHAMREVYVKIHQVAGSDTTVLVRGESGTGKELAASAVHYTSPRSQQPLVKVNCAALNEHLLESELFGHEKGAFTGATHARIGRIEEAEGGTLFLDEIGDFSQAIQVKLLRMLQEREFERVGSNRTIQADIRVIAATNQDLEARVAAGLFRQDLYYRINVFPIFLPPLRERRDDILLLADHFVAKYARKMGKEVRRISTPAINMMFAYHWPGNVRELENCIEYAVVLSTDGVIHGQNLPPTLQLPELAETARAGSLKARVEVLEKDLIMDALKSNHGHLTAAAQQLGITPRMVRYKIKNLGIDYRRFFKKLVS
ncbi:MAG: sigma 54-interacting transcriptional regulator [Planctomycetota bacterium]|nr:sigma 54-interacting transcriptional regulator [Planctomycetota bacterium]